MPEPEHHRQDERLQAVLREWVMDPCLPPRFEGGVWRRIQRAEAAPPKATSLAKLLLVRLLSALARPTAAALFVVLFLLVGGFAGLVNARRETASMNEDLRALYVQTISPRRGGLQSYQATERQWIQGGSGQDSSCSRVSTLFRGGSVGDLFLVGLETQLKGLMAVEALKSRAISDGGPVPLLRPS